MKNILLVVLLGGATAFGADNAALPSVAADGALATEVLRLHSEGGEDPRAYPLSVELNSLGCYRLSFEARALPGSYGQCLCAGIEGANVDLTIDTEWRPYRVIVAAPYSSTGKVQSKVAFRLWNFFGDVEVRAIRLEPVKAVDATLGEQPLSAAESLLGNYYCYRTVWGGEGHNRDRARVRDRKLYFNTNRTELPIESELVYVHGFAGRKLLSGKITLRVFKKDCLVVEVSKNGSAWQSLSTELKMDAGLVAKIPEEFFPAEKLQVRVRRVQKGGLQVSGYVFTAKVDGECGYLHGATRFVAGAENDEAPVAQVPMLYREDFGELLSASSPTVALWRAPSGRQVSQCRAVPQAMASGIEIRAAANEAEAVQLVITPREQLTGVMVTASGDLKGPNGAVIPASAVTIAQVGYVPVTIPTDPSTVPGLYPDPLLAQSEPRVLSPGRNYPYWVRIKVPKGISRGIYRGEVVIAGTALRVPLAVKVYGFELPDTMTVKTLFGQYGLPALYHGAKSSADVRRVNESYYQAMSDCHLSPYHSVGGWNVTWQGDEPVFDWRSFDARAKAMLGEKYHFNAFALAKNGFGVGVSVDDPRYEIRLEKLLKGIEEHFAEQGLLDKAIIYAYDEPSPKDDSKVAAAFAKFKKYAPRLRRILTTPCRDSLVGAPDIWCTVASDFDNATARRQRAAGDEFWLYVCMQPLAPYATTFSDHPSLELRTWLWQAWQRDVKGILIWAVDYWNPRGIVDGPDKVVNPYANAMTWRVGGGTYGNGDGRFFYPPRSVFTDPKALGSTLRTGPNFEPPVPTIRAEMLRDGIEDYEYFAMLRKFDPKSPLLTVPAEVTKSLTEFSTDPRPMLLHRERLAQALESSVPIASNSDIMPHISNK